MAIFDFPAGRFVVVGGFAAAIALSPAIAAFAGPGPTVGTPVAACPTGESEDPYTFACVPELAPSGVAAPAMGAPSEQELTACSGRDQGECVENDLYGPGAENVPHVDTSVHQSP